MLNVIEYEFVQDGAADKHWWAFDELTIRHLDRTQDYRFAAFIVEGAIEDVQLSEQQVKRIQNCQGIAVLFQQPLRNARKSSPESAPFLSDFLNAIPSVKFLVEGFESVTQRLVIFVGYHKQTTEVLWLEVPEDQQGRWHTEGFAKDRKQVEKRKRDLGIADR